MTHHTHRVYEGRVHFFMGDSSPLVDSLTEEEVKPYMTNMSISRVAGGHSGKKG